MNKELTCNQVSALISFYIKGKLNSKLKEYVDLHLERCPNCRKKITDLQNMLNKMYEVSGDYKCPFDVSIIFKTKEEEIEAKYCHDSCGVLVIQGVYYILEDQDAKWLSELIDGKFTK